MAIWGKAAVRNRLYQGCNRLQEMKDASAACTDLNWGTSQWNGTMPFVVTENCIKCKYTDCFEVGAVDCFHEVPKFLVIDPDECIDCTL